MERSGGPETGQYLHRVIQATVEAPLGQQRAGGESGGVGHGAALSQRVGATFYQQAQWPTGKCSVIVR